MKLPNNVKKKLVEIAAMRPGITEPDIIYDYTERFNSDKVKKFVFDNETEKHVYVLNSIWKDYICRPPTKQYRIIPLGIGGCRKTKTGKMAEIYAIVASKEIKPTFARINLVATTVKLIKEVQLGAKPFSYTIKLSQYKGGDFLADDRAQLSNPQQIKQSYNNLLKKIKAKQITIKEAESGKYHTKVGQDKYLVKTDWRIIEAMVVRCNVFERKDGEPGGVYSISDMTETPTQTVDKDGNIRSPGLTVWCAPELAIYEAGSKCRFIGTVTEGKDKFPMMNAVNIIPKHTVGAEE